MSGPVCSPAGGTQACGKRTQQDPGAPEGGAGGPGRRQAPGSPPPHPGGMSSECPAGKTRARLSAQRRRPSAARLEFLSGTPGLVEAGLLRVACSLSAGLGPSGSHRAPAAAAAAAAPCHGWRQLGTAPLSPPPVSARPPEGAPSPRQLVRPRGPSASRSAARPLPSFSRELANGLEAPRVPCTRPEPRRLLPPSPLTQARTLLLHNPSQTVKPTAITFHKTLPHSCSSSLHPDASGTFIDLQA